jgi:chitinase
MRLFTAIRRISPIRLVIVFLAGSAIVTGGTLWVRASIDDLTAEAAGAWVAPYVDVTLPPLLHFEDPTEQPSPDVARGFIVAESNQSCSPSWGTYYSLDAAARALDLDRRIVRLRERGGNAIVSFGGAVNAELATVCKDVGDLTAAYQAVVDRYDLTVLDFDIEGATLGDVQANTRRAEAIKRLQDQNQDLQVWLTLPVSPDGLTREGVALVDQTLKADVRLAGVNVMTMDYGGSRPASMSMRAATESALNATWQQLFRSLSDSGQTLTDHEVWQMLGATPMIGQNDVPGEVFTTDDAAWLTAFARDNHLGRISFWSANRDIACGPEVTDSRVSNTCSSVAQDPLEFVTTFLAEAPSGGSLPDQPIETPPATTTGRTNDLGYDDPGTSPYPIWRPAKQYVAGDKIVWQNRVYEAKWWSEGQQPDAPVENAWDSPWRYLGPVLESDRVAVKEAARPDNGERPQWDSEAIYVAGDEVVYGNEAFKAKWWTQGDTPQANPDRPYDNPWEYLGKVVAPAADESTATPAGTPAPGTATATPSVATGLSPAAQATPSATSAP